MPRIALTPKAIGSLRGVGVGSGSAWHRIFFLARTEARAGAGGYTSIVGKGSGVMTGYGKSAKKKSGLLRRFLKGPKQR